MTVNTALPAVVLQRGPEIVKTIQELEFLEAFLAPFSSAMGLPAFAMLIGGPLILGLWSWTQDFFAPAIVLALFGGVMIAAAPGPVALIGVGIVMVALAIAFYTIYA